VEDPLHAQHPRPHGHPSRLLTHNHWSLDVTCVGSLRYAVWMSCCVQPKRVMKELILTEQTNQTFISFNRIPDVLYHLGTEIVVASDGPLNLGAPEA
jgi:hypothetical protein